MTVWPHRHCWIAGMASQGLLDWWYGLRGTVGLMVWPMGAPSPPVVVRRNFEKFTKICISPFLGSKMGQKKVEIEGAGPP